MNLFQRAKEALAEIGADAWLIYCNERNDIHSEFMLNVILSIAHYIFIPQQGPNIVVTCGMEKPMAEKALENLGVEGDVIAYEKTADTGQILKKLIGDKTIALNFGENLLLPNSTRYADILPGGELRGLQQIAPNAKFVSAAHVIYKLRSIKSPADAKDLAEVAKINIEILEDLPNWVKIGMTENEVKQKLAVKYMEYGDLAFPAIVANNANAADPHHNGSDKKIEKGVLLIDSGMRPNRMCTDITWTYWVGGEPSQEFSDAYHTIYEAKQASFKLIKAGVDNKTPDKIIRDIFAERGYDPKLYNHGLGHALGFVVHDVGVGMSSNSLITATLEEGMIITHEPGLYWQGKWGIRLEDDIIIKKDSIDIVTYCPRDPLII